MKGDYEKARELYRQARAKTPAGVPPGQPTYSTAYTYLPQSARAFPEPPVLARIIEAAGWSEVRYKLLGMGAVAVHMAIKL